MPASTFIDSPHTCRLGVPGDVSDVLRVFKGVYGVDAWPGLGPRSARRFVEGHVSHADKMLVVCEDGAGTIVGACLGTAGADRYFRFLWQEEPALWLAFVQDIGARPKTALRFARQLHDDARTALVRSLKLGKHQGTQPADLAAGTAHIAHYFVCENARGNGVGTKMIACFEMGMRERGQRLCDIRTTRENIASQRAIERAGFCRIATMGNLITFQKHI